MSLLKAIALLLALILGMADAASVDSRQFGVTFYGESWAGNRLGCGGVYNEQLSPWAAVPIEWIRDGYVECGDLVVAVWPDGRTLAGPVRDTGCHLHYTAWDTGEPFGAEFDVYHREGLPTQTATVAIFRDGVPLPIRDFPLTADATEYCDGPLTVDSK